MEASDTIPLSVVVGTTQPWPEVEGCIESIFGEARELGAEVIVVDNNGTGLPSDAATRYPGVIWVTEAGAPVYRLRAVGMARARGEIVALTEDHCRVRPGWCKAHLEAHRSRPDVAAIGGPVQNAATRRLCEWALYLVNHASFTGPQDSGERTRLDHANISFKRRFVPSEPSREGIEEPALERILQRAGERLFFDTGIVLEHDQRVTPFEALALIFHAGRATAGMELLRGMSARRRLRGIVSVFAVPPVFFLRTLGALIRQRRVPAKALASLPFHALVLCLAATGLFWGYVAGPGGSAQHIP